MEGHNKREKAIEKMCKDIEVWSVFVQPTSLCCALPTGLPVGRVLFGKYRKGLRHFPEAYMFPELMSRINVALRTADTLLCKKEDKSRTYHQLVDHLSLYVVRLREMDSDFPGSALLRNMVYLSVQHVLETTSHAHMSKYSTFFSLSTNEGNSYNS